MIRINRKISIRKGELSESFVRSPGPGGQNVNKLATCVQLRFDVANSPSLPEDLKQRLMRLGGRRLSAKGVLIINARRYRTRQRNREDALQRLIDLVRRAATTPKRRRKTSPTLASRRRRVAEKKRRSQTKRLRQTPQDD